MSSPILFLDTASPVVSLALGAAGEVIGERQIALRRSSEKLLRVLEEMLAENGLELAGLGGIVVLRGPGSFTGLRIGLATVLGFHQALGLPATALPTLPVLAAAVRDAALGDAHGLPIVAAVDAMRGDWYVQRFRPPRDQPSAVEAVRSQPSAVEAVRHSGAPEAMSAASLSPGAALAELAPCRLIGFGVGRLAGEAWLEDLDGSAKVLELMEPPALAPVAARMLSRGSIEWDPQTLTSPIYFRPPAVTVPPPPPCSRRHRAAATTVPADRRVELDRRSGGC